MGPQSGLCAECNQAVKRTDSVFTCDVCEKWMHCKCVNMDEGDYKRLQALLLKKYKQIKINCTSCEKTEQKLRKLNENLEKLLERDRKKEEQIEKQAQDLLALNEKLSKLVEETRQRFNQQAQGPSTSSGAQAVINPQNLNQNRIIGIEENINKIKEEKEIEKREKNAIMYNLNETENREDDIQAITNVLQKVKLLDKVERNDKNELLCFRLGKEALAERRRPILIKFVDKYSKVSFLKSWKELKEMNLWSQLDMTIKQRADNRILLQELGERRNAGENVKIRRGKIVPKDF